jgi:hypothetical protein
VTKREDSTRHILEYRFNRSGTSLSAARRNAEDEVTSEQDVQPEQWADALEGDEVWVIHPTGQAKPSVLYAYGPFVSE